MVPHNTFIEELRIKNFQSIKEGASIKLGALNFIYGPNSAGKSAIGDALTLIEEALRGRPTDLIERWQNNQSKINREEMTLGVTFRSRLLIDHFLNEDFPPEFRIDGGFLQGLCRQRRYDIDFRFPSYGDEDVVLFAVKLDGLQLFEISLDEYAWSLKIKESSFGDEMKLFLSRHFMDLSEDDIRVIEACLESKPLKISLLASTEERSFELEMILLINYIIGEIAGIKFAPKLIDGDRGTISDQVMSSAFFAQISSGLRPYVQLGFSSGATRYPDSSVISTTNLTKGVYAEVLLSVARNWVSGLESAQHKDLQQEEDGLGMLDADADLHEKESLHEFVNRCLSDHLFIESGYQIRYEINELMPSGAHDGNHAHRLVKFRSGSTVEIVNLFVVSWLTDSSDNQTTFSDVGSGISCVVPVLVGLAGGRAFIQQPELHLHPALQSALGDVFIEAIKLNDNSLHIIETHSEYPLLRCLRRIRESSSGKIAENNPLYLTHKDIKIHYFEPQGDGTTTAKSIRVGSDGSFLDRWPRGFFAERATELFDE